MYVLSTPIIQGNGIKNHLWHFYPKWLYWKIWSQFLILTWLPSPEAPLTWLPHPPFQNWQWHTFISNISFEIITFCPYNSLTLLIPLSLVFNFIKPSSPLPLWLVFLFISCSSLLNLFTSLFSSYNFLHTMTIFLLMLLDLLDHRCPFSLLGKSQPWFPSANYPLCSSIQSAKCCWRTIKQLFWLESFQNHAHTWQRHTTPSVILLYLPRIFNSNSWKLLLEPFSPSFPLTHMLWSYPYFIFLPLVLRCHRIHTHVLPSLFAPMEGHSLHILWIPPYAAFIKASLLHFPLSFPSH